MRAFETQSPQISSPPTRRPLDVSGDPLHVYAEEREEVRGSSPDHLEDGPSGSSHMMRPQKKRSKVHPSPAGSKARFDLAQRWISSKKAPGALDTTTGATWRAKQSSAFADCFTDGLVSPYCWRLRPRHAQECPGLFSSSFFFFFLPFFPFCFLFISSAPPSTQIA